LSPAPRKRFGQHWLTSDAILAKIVAAAAIAPTDTLLEIGPGTGLLTRRLLAQGATVVAVEIDRDLCGQLAKRLGRESRFLLLQGDFLELDIEALIQAVAPPAEGTSALPNKVVANIPYYITGPILEKLLGSLTAPAPRPYQSIVLLVQKEVADRLCAKPGRKAFGALSVRVQYLADCQRVCEVPARAFQPPPKVASAVVKLVPRPFATPALQPAHLAQLVKQGFSSKRKMLRNNLKGAVDRDRLTATMAQLAIPPTARAEDVSVDQWVALSNALAEDPDPVISPDASPS